MIRNAYRSAVFAGVIASASWLTAGAGCTPATHSPMDMDMDMATDAGGGDSCTAHEGDHCGGNIKNPCSCAAGLVCSTVPGDGPAPGDVGGICQKAPPAAGSGGATAQGGNGSTAGHDAEPDAGTCVSHRGGPCGGNVKNPCECAAGLLCKANPATNMPPGDVGGICEPLIDEADAGVCVSDEGGICGGNTRFPCTCAAGLSCTANPGSTLPFGDVGGTCRGASTQAECSSAADCVLKADYCTGCDCVALAPGESLKQCSGPGVSCFADPCASKTAQCDSGRCLVH